MEWNDSALVLRLGRFREADIWLKILTRRHGIVSAFAFGGSRSRRRFVGCLDTLNEIRINARGSRSGQYLVLQEGVLVKSPQRLRRDWKRYGMFMNCIRFLEVLGVPPDGTTGAWELTKSTLAFLEQAAAVHSLFPMLFRFRLACEQGYAPLLGTCSVCGRELSGNAFFRVAEGTLTCGDCLPPGGLAVPLSGESLALLRRVQTLPPEMWFEPDGSANAAGSVGQLAFTPENRSECVRAIEGFVQYHLGLVWDNGRFRRA